MAHETLRLLQSLHNTPHLVTSDYLDFVTSFLSKREGVQMALGDSKVGNEPRTVLTMDGKTAIMTIDGPLTTVRHTAMCGPSPMSYKQMLSDAEIVIPSGIKTLVLDMNTPGGQAYQMMESSRRLRQMADDNGVKIIAYVNGMAASAGYGIAAVAHEIVMNPEAQVGSVGVVVRLMDTSKAMENAGYKPIFVFAGKSKIPYDANGTFSESFISEIQSSVDELYVKFTSHVAAHRNMSVEDVINTDAKMFNADKAVELGLADKIMEEYQFLQYVGIVETKGKEMSIADNVDTKPIETSVEQFTEQLSTMQSTIETLQQDIAEKVSGMEGLTTQVASLVTENTSLREQLSAFIVKAEQEKSDKRLDALMKVGVNKEDASAMCSNLSSLSDEAFECVVAGMKSTSYATTHQHLFEEEGVDVDANLSAPVDDPLDRAIQKLIDEGK